MGESVVCKNCGSAVKGKYCSVCGQKSDVARITFASLWHQLVHFFTHMEHGFLFTTWQMIISPGRMVLNYLYGKRKSYQPPVSYFLIWTTAYIILLFWIEKAFGQNTVIDYRAYFGTDVSTRFAISHLSVVLAVLVPVHTLFLYLLVTRRIHSFAETMVAVIYALGSIIFCQFFFAVLALLLFAMRNEAVSLLSSDFFKVIYLGWFITDFVRHLDLKQKGWRAILYLIMAFGVFSAWRLVGLPMVLKAFFPEHI